MLSRGRFLFALRAPAAFALLVGAELLEATHEVVARAGRQSPLFDDWLHDGLIFAAAALCLLRATRRRTDRAAWWFIDAGVCCLGLGEVTWGLLYDQARVIPYPNPTDFFNLATYRYS